MRLEILYGRAGSGKSQECIKRIQKLIAAGERCVMIVPEQFCYKTEKFMVESIGAASSETAEVLTFTRLAGRIFAQNSGTVKIPLSPAGKNILAFRALSLVKTKLQTYLLAAQKSGFADKVMTLISEFKRYGVTADELFELAKKAEKPAFGAKLLDLAVIYQKYEELFLEDYSDFEDNLYLAAELLQKGDYLKNTHIFIDEFTDFLPQHYKMIEALCNRASDITVCLCADKTLGTHGIFAPASKTYFRLKQISDTVLIPFSSTYLQKANGENDKNKELLHLEENYQKINYLTYPDKTENISIFEALNVYSEIENAARNILYLVREKGARWRDIVVCCGEADMYFEPLRMIFSKYGIPYFLSEKRELSTYPPVLALLSALDILVEGFSYESVFTYLKTGFANIDSAECDLLENYVLATGVSKRAWTSEKPWDYKSSVLEEAGENPEIDAIRRRVIEPLMKLRENVGGKHTVTHSCKALYEFICELEIDKKTAERIEEFKQNGDFVRANTYTRIWNSILDVLDQVVLILGDKKIGMEQFKNLLETGFLKEQMGIIPQLSDTVAVLGLSNARQQKCDYLFVLGTNGSAFSGKDANEGLLGESEREMLENMGAELAPSPRKSLFDTEYLIYKALTRAEKKIFLSYAISKMDGGALASSQLCGHIREIFPKISMDSDATRDKNEIFISTPNSTFGEFVKSMSDDYKGQREVTTQLYKWYSTHEPYSQRLESLKKALLYKNEAKTLLPVQIESLYPDGIKTSVSRLERYSKCPFSYFIEYTLKAKERKVLKIGAPDIGSIMHAVLEQFIKYIQQQNFSWNELDDEFIGAAVTSIVDEMSEKILSGSTLAGKAMQYLLLRLKRNLVRCAKLLIEHIASSSFEPVGSEVRFGDDGELSAVIVDIASGKKLKIRGIIDRIDKCETPDGVYYRVIDYKSGNKTFSLESIYNKLDLQLVVYLDAAMQDTKGAKPAGMLYFNIREPMIKTGARVADKDAGKALKESMKLDGLLLNDEQVIRKMDRNYEQGSEFLPVNMTQSGQIRITSSLATMEQFKILSEYVKTSLKQIGNSIISGKIDIAPYRNADSCVCSYCQYKSVCKIDSGKNSYRWCQKANASEIWEMFYKGRG